MSLRPLLKLNSKKQDTFLPSSYAFSAQQISKIKKYLPKTLTFSGIDAEYMDEDLKQQLQRQKLKAKSINGIQITSEKPLSFYNQKHIYLCQWANVFVVLDIPYNNKQNSEDEKDQLQSKLAQYLQTHLIFSNKKSKAIIDKTKEMVVNPLELQIHLGLTELPSQSYDNSIRKLRFKCPVALFLNRQQPYTMNRIAKMVEEDLFHCIKIMIKNKLSIRILRKSMNEGQSLLLQSFVAKETQIQNEQKKLNELLSKTTVREIVEESSQEIQLEKDKPIRKQLTNRQLLCIFFGLFCVYLFLKINPLMDKQNRSL